MLKKYQILLNQLIQWYHLEKSELEDLELYLKRQLQEIENRKAKI